MEIEISLMSHEDIDEFIDLIAVFADVFEMESFVKPDKSYLQTILKQPNFLALIAKASHQVVGGLTVYIIDQYYSKKPLAYIYDLAVLKPFQRQGIGKALIKYLKDYCKKNNFEEVFVQADRMDDHAIDFYRSIKGGREEEVVHFSYPLFHMI